MQSILNRDTLHAGLSQVIGGVEKRQTMPILSNVLIDATEKQLRLTTTDLEIQLEAVISGQVQEPGKITVNARTLNDIIRSLPADKEVNFVLNGNFLEISCEDSLFKLSTLPAEEFPHLDTESDNQSVEIKQDILANMLNLTHFSMANQDVRYFLNGMLIELEGSFIRCVSTDGHRLSLAEHQLANEQNSQQIIIPRKTVLELTRALNANAQSNITLHIAKSQIRTQIDNLSIISKLIEGRFPDYKRVIPEHNSIEVKINRNSLRSVLQRASILSGDKNSGAQFHLKNKLIEIETTNSDQEQSKEQIPVDYQGEPLKICLLYTSPSPRDRQKSRMPSSA